MQGSEHVIKALNEVLKNELTAINQYFLHSRIVKDWGYSVLYAHIHQESIDEMKHADMLISRILFLQGKPSMQSLHQLEIGKTVEDIIHNDLTLERKALPIIIEAMSASEKVQDYATRDLLLNILKSEESHIDWLSEQIGNVLF